MWAFTYGPVEITVIVLVTVLLFGRRLPEVGRYLGRNITAGRDPFEPDVHRRVRYLFVIYLLILLSFLILVVFWLVRVSSA